MRSRTTPEQRLRYKDRVRRWLREFKRHAACLECGATWPAELHFHHLDPAEKDNTISKLVGQAHSERAVILELEKCVVLCRDCHAELHGLAPSDFKHNGSQESPARSRQLEIVIPELMG